MIDNIDRLTPTLSYIKWVFSQKRQTDKPIHNGYPMNFQIQPLETLAMQEGNRR